MNTPTPDPFQENADLIRAIADRPPVGNTPLPEKFRDELERNRQSALQARSQPAAGKIVWFRSPAFRAVACMALLLTVATLYFRSSEDGSVPRNATARIVITSPGDEITNLQPTIAWNSKDPAGQKYDVWILPAEGDALTIPSLFQTTNVTSPVHFSSLERQPGASANLEPGKPYRVLVCLAAAGRTAGVPVPFKVTSPKSEN